MLVTLRHILHVLRTVQPFLAVAAASAFMATVFGRDFGAALFAAFVGAPIFTLLTVGWLVALIVQRGEARRWTLLSLGCLFATATLLFGLQLVDTGDRLRWWGDGDRFRAAAKAAPGELAYATWDEDGFGGLNFFRYLVHDPSDQLAARLAAAPDNRVPGIPCRAVPDVRLAPCWYIVTITDGPRWDCGEAR